MVEDVLIFKGSYSSRTPWVSPKTHGKPERALERSELAVKEGLLGVL